MPEIHIGSYVWAGEVHSVGLILARKPAILPIVVLRYGGSEYGVRIDCFRPCGPTHRHYPALELLRQWTDEHELELSLQKE